MRDLYTLKPFQDPNGKGLDLYTLKPFQDPNGKGFRQESISHVLRDLQTSLISSLVSTTSFNPPHNNFRWLLSLLLS